MLEEVHSDQLHMVFRDAVDKISGLRFVYEHLDFSSSMGRQLFLNTPWLSTIDDINNALDEVEKYKKYLSAYQGISDLCVLLSEHVNIQGSIDVLKQKDSICTDIDFFEFKKLALIDEKIDKLSVKYNFDLSPRPSLLSLLSILDPNNDRLKSFFLSDAFESSLLTIRNDIDHCNDEIRLAELNLLLAQKEEDVRKKLTDAIRPFITELELVQKALATDDMLISKAKWSHEFGTIRPVPLTEGDTILKGLRHPAVEWYLKKEGKAFQDVSIVFGNEPTLITGANMSGKSVLLHAISISQALMQFGMFVPANQAQMVVVDEIAFSVGEGEDQSKGLSSYGAEILRINKIISKAKNGIKLLAIIDEPARTTNPQEGFALVQGLVKLFEKYQVRALITTHYSGISYKGRGWRVRGFTEHIDAPHLKVNQLEQYMDYSLENDEGYTVPHEAITIAKLLGVDTEYLELSKQSIKAIQYEK